MHLIDWRKLFIFFIFAALALTIVSADDLISAEFEDVDLEKEIDASPICDHPETFEENYIVSKYPVTTNYSINRINNVTLVNETEIRFVTYEAIEYGKKTIIQCTPEKTDAIIIDDGKEQRVLDCDREKYTCSFKEGVLTKKDLSAGGTWQDRDLNNCWNPGVPCKQVDYSKDIYEPETKLEFKDINKEAIK